MAKKEKTTLEILQEELLKLENKKSRLFFYVVDSKGTPVGTLSYIYEIAYQLKEKGYDVQMLHSEAEFVGVGSWLGEKYANLPHHRVDKDSSANVVLSPSDILFIPELCSGLMSATKNVPCKRVAILHNFSYLTESMPAGVSWADMKIRECIVTSERLAEKVKSVFPYVKTYVIRPAIPNYFYFDDKKEEAKNLVINVVTDDSRTLDNIIKPFYWKYPNYTWVAFQPINRNLIREEFGTALKRSFATIWADTATDFGFSALEAMAAKNIVIGKIPENTPEWMQTADGTIRDNGIWFYNDIDATEQIAAVTHSFLTENLPQRFFDEMAATAKEYTVEKQAADIDSVIVNTLIEERKKELNIAVDIEKNDIKENNKKETE